MTTGPHADHTTGIPFQGHYMVINTNAEVYTKRARLISPLYRLNATTLCFKFFYNMYGINVGTLRVYMKPESVEISDILNVGDAESEVMNDYLLFNVKGKHLQAALWLLANQQVYVDSLLLLLALGRKSRKCLARKLQLFEDNQRKLPDCNRGSDRHNTAFGHCL